MEEPWQIFIEELRAPTEGVGGQVLPRGDELLEAAQEASESTADILLSELDYDEEEALALAKAFAQGVEKWIEEGEMDWEELRERLEMLQQEWELKGDVPA